MTRIDRPSFRGQTVSISPDQVAAFRLSRHHLVARAPAGRMVSVLGDVAGTQAQLLSAAQIALWSRVRNVGLDDIATALWKDRVLVKAWCMRRTMFLLPSDSLALFVRGSARRARRETQWVLSHDVSERGLDRLLEGVLDALCRPLTQSALADELSGSLRYQKRYIAGGGGWGNRRKLPWIEVEGLALPAGYLLHLVGAVGVICSGPNVGAESTYVRADRWVPEWKDTTGEEAEGELLRHYLRAFGPATLADFRLWTGMFASDAKEIWERGEDEMTRVEVEGVSSFVLRSDLESLVEAELDRPVVRLLPYFDSFVLGHKSHRNIVSEGNHLKVYRPQGWVSPTLLIDGRAEGIWSYAKKKNGRLSVLLEPFTRLPRGVVSRLREEADDLGRFLGCPDVETRVAEVARRR
jgi:uncharacterized protein YcaQ